MAKLIECEPRAKEKNDLAIKFFKKAIKRREREGKLKSKCNRGYWLSILLRRVFLYYYF